MALSRLSANLSMRRGWARRRSSAIHAAQAAEAVSLRLETKLFEPALTADAGEIASPEGLRALIEAAWREARRETLGRWCRFRTAMVTSLRRSRSVQLAERLRPPNQARFVLALQFGDHGRAIPTRLTARDEVVAGRFPSNPRAIAGRRHDVRNHPAAKRRDHSRSTTRKYS